MATLSTDLLSMDRPRLERASADSARPLDRARVDPRVAALSIVGFWLFYFALNTGRYWFTSEPYQLDAMARRAVVSMFGIGLTLLLAAVLRRFDHRPIRTLFAVAAVASLPIAFTYAAFNYAAFYVVSPSPGTAAMVADWPEHKRDPLYLIVGGTFDWYFFIVTWATLYIALSYAAKVKLAEQRAAKYRAVAQTAELRALRYQINPHFLFNTLNSLSSLVLGRREEEAERMIMNLSTFFRTSLTADPTADVSLADEIRLQRLYLDIERVRFPERLLVEIDVPPELDGARIPGLLLQPLVENSIKYGVSRSKRQVTIGIRAQALDGRLRLIVEDDGDGAGPTEPGHGVGVRNVCDRLDARFGPAARCEAGAKEKGGWRVVLTLPLVFDDRR